MLSVRAPFGPSEMDLLLGCGVLSPVDSLSGSPTSSLSGLGLVLYNSLAILVSLPCYAWWCYSPRIRLMLWNAYRKSGGTTERYELAARRAFIARNSISL